MIPWRERLAYWLSGVALAAAALAGHLRARTDKNNGRL